MRCREGQTSSTQKCSIFVSVNWMDITKEVFMVGNLFSIINVSFVISITSDTTTYPITKAVIHNKIVTFHWQTIFVIEDCEIFLPVITFNKKNASILILNSPGSVPNYSRQESHSNIIRSLFRVNLVQATTRESKKGLTTTLEAKMVPTTRLGLRTK